VVVQQSEELNLDMEPGQGLHYPSIGRLVTGFQCQDARISFGKTLHLPKNVKPILQVKLRRSEVAPEELQADKDNTSDERHTTRFFILGIEVWLQMCNGLDVLLQRKLLLLAHLRRGRVSMYVQCHDTLLVRRAERKQGMQHSGFSRPSLEDEGVPEAGRESG